MFCIQYIVVVLDYCVQISLLLAAMELMNHWRPLRVYGSLLPSFVSACDEQYILGQCLLLPLCYVPIDSYVPLPETWQTIWLELISSFAHKRHFSH
jgi:hypothetical protein